MVNGAWRSDTNTNGDCGSCSRRRRRRARSSRPESGCVLGERFGPVHMQPTGVEVDGVPPETDQFRHPEPVPIGEQNHGGVPVAITGRSTCATRPRSSVGWNGCSPWWRVSRAGFGTNGIYAEPSLVRRRGRKRQSSVLARPSPSCAYDDVPIFLLHSAPLERCHDTKDVS